MLTFKGTDLGIQAGCNSMFATVRPGDDGLVVQGPIGGTEMGCDAPRMDQDSWLAKLPRGRDDHSPGRHGPGQQGHDRHHPGRQVVGHPTVALVGTTWLFDTQINGDTAASMPLGADQLWLRLVGVSVDLYRLRRLPYRLRHRVALWQHPDLRRRAVVRPAVPGPDLQWADGQPDRVGLVPRGGRCRSS